jgi:hypothetical protein
MHGSQTIAMLSGQLMHFYSDLLMYFCSGVDNLMNSRVRRRSDPGFSTQILWKRYLAKEVRRKLCWSAVFSRP